MQKITRTIYTTTIRLGAITLSNGEPTIAEIDPIIVKSTSPLTEKEVTKKLRMYPRATVLETTTESAVLAISLDDFIQHATPVTRPPSQR